MSYCHLDVVENGFNFVSLFYVVNCQFETNQGSFAGIFQSTEGDVLSWLFIGGHFCLSKIYQKKKKKCMARQRTVSSIKVISVMKLNVVKCTFLHF